MANIKNNKMFRAFFSVTGVILISKLFGFVKQMVTANAFGATIDTDVINLAESFTGNIKYVLVQTVLTSFVAIYLNAKQRDEKHARSFAMDSGKVLTVIAAVIVAAVSLFAPQIARIIAPSYTAEMSQRLAAYLRLFAPTLILFVWMSVFHGLLNANKRFIPGEMEGLNQSVILIVLIAALQGQLGVQVLAVAYIAQAIWNTTFLGISSRRYLGPSSGNPFRNEDVKKLLKMAGPLLLGYSMVYINEQVGKILVSGLKAGTVTAMSYAAVLSNLVATFITSFCSILFPFITTHITKGEDEQAAGLVTKAAVILALVFLPISILTYLCAEDIVAVVFGRGAFTAENVKTSASALAGYSVMFVPLCLKELFSRFQYGYQNSKIPMINSTVGIAANILLSLILCPFFGVWGVAFASSVSTTICGILNLVTSKKCNGSFRMMPLVKQIPWLVAGGVFCGVGAMLCNRFFQPDSALLRFAATAVCGGAAYCIAASPLIWKILKKK